MPDRDIYEDTSYFMDKGLITEQHQFMMEMERDCAFKSSTPIKKQQRMVCIFMLIYMRLG